MEDVFDIQDEITEKIVEALKVKLNVGATTKIKRYTSPKTSEV
jgi:hypothetical protein